MHHTTPNQLSLCRLSVGRLGILLVLLTFAPLPLSAQLYELRTYVTRDGKLDDLNARFRDHTVGLFEKHGMKSMGYWVPTDGDSAKNTLIYVIEHKDMDSAQASWKAFLNDPEWKEVYQKSEAAGPILAKPPTAEFMKLTDYSPRMKEVEPSDDAVYEMRIYRTNEGKLPNLDRRFRDHTIDFFNRYGMKSVAYWHPTQEPASGDTLIYLLRHDSREAARKSWGAFAADEAWKKVVQESQKDGQFLRERPEVIYLKATDYSAIR